MNNIPVTYGTLQVLYCIVLWFWGELWWTSWCEVPHASAWRYWPEHIQEGVGQASVVIQTGIQCHGARINIEVNIVLCDLFLFSQTDTLAARDDYGHPSECMLDTWGMSVDVPYIATILHRYVNLDIPAYWRSCKMRRISIRHDNTECCVA